MNFILIAVIVLGTIALVSSVVLYVVSKKLPKEDPRLGTGLSILPGANCGGCGFQVVRECLTPCKGSRQRLIGYFVCPVGGQKPWDGS